MSHDVLDASPETLAVLPLLYVAWADGILTPTEIETIQSTIREQTWMDADVQERVCRFLDPQSPPTASEYRRWIRTLKQGAGEVSVDAETSLADLGARLAARRGDGAALSEADYRALIDLENALGIDGAEVVADLLGSRPSPVPASTEASFDVLEVAALLDGPHADLRAQIRTLLQDPAFDYLHAPDTDAYREQVLEWNQLLAEQGLGALAFPEEYGGAGDIEKFIVAFETLAYHDLSMVVKFGVQFGLFAGSIQRLGTERHHERYLTDAGTLALPGCFAMSENGHGSNVRDLETTATYDPEADEFVIHTPHDAARKEWIGNAALHGQVAVVFAQLHTLDESFGVHAFVVPIRTPGGTVCPGVRIEDCGHKMGLNGVDNGRIWFDHVRIPRANLLDRFATVDDEGRYDSPIPSDGKRFFTMLGTLVGGRISVARAGLSAAKSGLTIAIRYGERRRQFGPKDEAEVPLMHYRTHKRRLLPPLATTYALHAALESLTAAFAAKGPNDDMQDVEAEANALKAYTTWHTTDVLQTAREACGGQGYLTENGIADLKADTDVFTTFEGDNTVLMLQVAKGLLSDFQREFRDVNVFGMVQFVAGELATRLTEKNPVVTRQTDPAHLRSADFQTNAFRYRVDARLQSVAQALRARIKNDVSPFDAFVDVQDRLVDLSTAHAERIALDRFISFIDAADASPHVRNALERLRSLFALSRIEADAAWFLETGYVESGKACAISKEVNALCDVLRSDARGLVDAFAIPDAALASTIATDA